MDWSGVEGNEREISGVGRIEMERIGGKCTEIERSGVEGNGVEWNRQERNEMR